jgi:hypothetical protein
MPIASSAASAATVAASAGTRWWNEGFFTSELAKGLPAAIVALVIGLIAAGIAWRQKEIAHAKLNLDLFEDRFKLFNDLSALMTDAQSWLPPEELIQKAMDFTQSVAQAHFLFGETIGDYFEYVRVRALTLAQTGRSHARNDGDIPTKQVLQKRIEELVVWFETESRSLRPRFRDFLDFSRWMSAGYLWSRVPRSGTRKSAARATPPASSPGS